MATSVERQKLLAISCPWCHAAPGELCSKPVTRAVDTEGGQRKARRVPITTLDGGCHDARWQAAGMGPAPVIVERLAALQERDEAPASRGPAPVPQLVGAGPDDRPW